MIESLAHHWCISSLILLNLWLILGGLEQIRLTQMHRPDYIWHSLIGVVALGGVAAVVIVILEGVLK